MMAYRYLTLCVVAAVSLCLGQALTTPPYLLFSTWLTVSHMNLDGSGYEVLVDSSSNVGPQAVDYHWRLGLLFWSHYRDDTVSQANLDGSDPITIASDVDTPTGLAVDWINDKLYFSYAGTAANTYHMATYDITAGGDFEIIMTSSVRYYEIAVDPVAQQLYWTTGHALLRSSLTGQNTETLFTTTSLDCAFSLALYTKLYWTEDCFDSSLESVRALNLSTLEEFVIVENTTVDPLYGVAAFENTVYWTSPATIYSTSIDGGAAVSVVPTPSGFSSLRGIVVVHPDLQPYPENESSSTATITETVTAMESTTLAISPEEPTLTPTELPPSFVTATLYTFNNTLPTDTSPLPTNTAPLPTNTVISAQSTSAVSVTPSPSAEPDDMQSSNNLVELIQRNPIITALMIALALMILLLALGCSLFICRVRNRSKKKSVDVGFTENVSYSMSSMKQWSPSPLPPPPLKEATTQNAMPLENAEEDHVYENPEMYHIYEMDDVTPDDDNMIANASYVPVGSTLKTLEAAHSPATTAKQVQDPHCKSAIVDVVGQGAPVTRRNLPKSQSPVENRYSANPRSSTCESKEMHKAAAAAQTDGVSAPTPGEGEVEYMTMSLVEGDGQVPNSTPPQ